LTDTESCFILYWAYWQIQNPALYYIDSFHVQVKQWLSIWCYTYYVQQSNTQEFYYQLDAKYFSTYYTKLLHVSAIYPGHLQGVTFWSMYTAYMANCHL